MSIAERPQSISESRWRRLTRPAKRRDRIAKDPVPHVVRLPDDRDYVIIPLDAYERLVIRDSAREAQNDLADPTAEWFEADDVFRRFAADKLAAARKARRLTQKQLGDLIGVPQSQISRIERNPDHTTVRTMKKIAKALKVDVASLL